MIRKAGIRQLHFKDCIRIFDSVHTSEFLTRSTDFRHCSFRQTLPQENGRYRLDTDLDPILIRHDVFVFPDAEELDAVLFTGSESVYRLSTLSIVGKDHICL